MIKNRALLFSAIMFATIIITRSLTLLWDPNPKIGPYELHHFYYGIVILLITTLAIIFGKSRPKKYLILAAIAIGFILDEFIFIFGGFPNDLYSRTWPTAFGSAALIAIFIFILAHKKTSNEISNT
jgi:hypothetical protein